MPYRFDNSIGRRGTECLDSSKGSQRCGSAGREGVVFMAPIDRLVQQAWQVNQRVAYRHPNKRQS